MEPKPLRPSVYPERFAALVTPELGRRHTREYGVVIGGKIVAWGEDSFSAIRLADRKGFRVYETEGIVYIAPN